jgi:signal transduction histidine kinase
MILRDLTEQHKKQHELHQSNEQLRQFSVHLQSTHEETLKLMARDLHDDLGQLLAALQIDLSLLQKEAEKSTMASTLLNNMEAILTSAIAVLRRIATDVRPRALDEGGLYFALQSLRNNFIARHAIACELIANEADLALNEQCSTTLFRIVQEALTNVYRHANARHVQIVLERRAQMLLLRLSDDGRGIDDIEVGLRRRCGLHDICERVKALKGEIDLRNQPGGGLQIEIRLPLSHAASPNIFSGPMM